MDFYPSGTPANDVFQVIENQLCSHRLFSMHSNYKTAVMKWLDPVKAGILTFDDYCRENKQVSLFLQHRDTLQRQVLQEHAVTEKWPGYEQLLRRMSARFPEEHPSHIMLDSGAFTAWKSGKRVNLDDLRRAYDGFLKKADGCFKEVWLINLDEITDPSAEPSEKLQAIAASDRNLKILQADFGDRVLPVFHQGEGKFRLLEVILQANGYICVSPNNDLLEPERRDWAWSVNKGIIDLASDTRAHGLATTGSEMLRTGAFHSADSTTWKIQSGNGVVDLIQDQRLFSEFRMVGEDDTIEETALLEKQVQRFRSYHIARERNDYDREAGLVVCDNEKHYTSLPEEEQIWVRQRVEFIMPFLLAQFDARARELVNLIERRALAESIEPERPRIYLKAKGQPMVELGAPYQYELHRVPPEENQKSFLADPRFDNL